jgi:type I restriction enzyme, S subunit
MLPINWVETTLSEVYNLIGGGTPSKANNDYWHNGSIPWASVKDIKSTYIDDTIDHITEIALNNSTSRLADCGDVIVITRISPGKSSIAKRKIAINQDLKIVRTEIDIPSLFTHYLFSYLERPIDDY